MESQTGIRFSGIKGGLQIKINNLLFSQLAQSCQLCLKCSVVVEPETGGGGGGVFILLALMDDDFLWLTRLKPGSRPNYSSLPK